jgi:hypothetical protein
VYRDGAWTHVPHRPWWEDATETRNGDGRSLHPGEISEPRGLSDRNYDVFAILAGVRNAVGFAGVKTAETKFVPIDSPRGVPHDVSEGIRDLLDANALGEHSFSYVSLKELAAVEWETRSVTKRGVMGREEYERRQLERLSVADVPPPEEYSGAVMGQNIVTLTENEYKSLLELGSLAWSRSERRGVFSLTDRDGGAVDTLFRREKDGKSFIQRASDEAFVEVFVETTWDEPYASCAGRFFRLTLPALKEIADGNELRLVFGFDS